MATTSLVSSLGTASPVDALVVGGGPAGLSTALGLSRKRFRVLLFDSQEYRNDSTSHMHNFPGFDASLSTPLRTCCRSEQEATMSR